MFLFITFVLTIVIFYTLHLVIPVLPAIIVISEPCGLSPTFIDHCASLEMFNVELGCAQFGQVPIYSIPSFYSNIPRKSLPEMIMKQDMFIEKANKVFRLPNVSERMKLFV